MLSSISPYALLLKSKPHHPAQTTTDYDRFSMHHSYPHDHKSETLPDSHVSLEPSSRQKILPEKRTHYISDIHARHSLAMRHAPQNPPAL